MSGKVDSWRPRRSPKYNRIEGPQNRSPAVMSQRTESSDSLDDFPTPRWATRALLQEVLDNEKLSASSCWEPTCGRGYMSATLSEYFASVKASDIHPYGFGDVFDFLADRSESEVVPRKHDWLITNPPFRLAEEFARRALDHSRVGAAMLVRTGFIEGAGRFERLFQPHPPSIIAQFVERVPILKGRVDPKASTATGYCWLVWIHGRVVEGTELRWIPPCRRSLERIGDYDDPRMVPPG